MTAQTFKHIYYGFHPKLYRVALRMMENEEDAADAVQETYCSLWERRHRLVDVETPEAYAIGSLRNCCLNKLRQREKERTTDISPDLAGDSFDTRIEADEGLNALERLVADLPERQRKVFMFRHYDDCSYEEIGKMMALTVENVRMILSRTRKTLREQYDKINKL